MWGERAHLPVRKQAHRATLLKKEVKRPFFRRLGRSQLSRASPPRAALVGRQRAIFQQGPGNQQVEPLVDILFLQSQAPEVAFLRFRTPGSGQLSNTHSGKQLMSLDQGPSRDRQPGLPCALPDPKDSACRNGQTGQAGVWSWPIDAREGSWQDQMVIQQAATSVLLPYTSDY